jgi:HlyD family secretion protein
LISLSLPYDAMTKRIPFSRVISRASSPAVPAAAIVAALAALLAAVLATPPLHAADDRVPAAGAASAAKPALTVTITQPQKADWPITVSGNGSIAAWQEAVIGAEANGLRLVDVAAQVGDRVRKGQLLARLNSDTLTADRAASLASLAEAQASLAEAQANAERARQLQASGAISTQQIQQYTTGEATAKARVASLKAGLQASDVRLAQARILAPDDGVISSRTATLGAVVTPGQELFRLIRQSRLEWRAEVAATDLAKLAPGMPARVQPAGGAPVEGQVRLVAPTVDAATRNGLVYVDLPAGGAAKAGMFARGDFEVGRASGLTLPQSAVLLRDGFAYVFRLMPDSKVAQTKVTVGRRVGDRIEITSGLDAGASVAASGAGFLGDRDLVRVIAAEKNGAAQ